jgi:hypothetical protein
MSSRTFAAFSKINLNTSKYTFMEVFHLVEGHNFHVEWHFKFWVEIGAKLDGLAVVDAKSALNAKHTASRTKLASHAQRAKDVPVNFS